MRFLLWLLLPIFLLGCQVHQQPRVRLPQCRVAVGETPRIGCQSGSVTVPVRW